MMRRYAISAGLLALMAGGVSTASANIFTLANVVAAKANQIPGQALGITWGDFSSPSISSTGRIAFGLSNIGGVAAVNNRGAASGFDAASMAIVGQSGTTAPGAPAGALMQTAAAASSAFSSSSFRVSSGDTETFVSVFSGGGVTAGVNDSGIFSSYNGGAFNLLARRGVTTVNGTGGAVLSATFDTGNQNTTHSANGTVYFKQTLTGGDVSGTTNNTGLFAATPAGVNLIARKGQAAPGGGAGVTYNAIGFVTQSNATGQFLYDTSVQGAGVTTANDTVLYRHTPGSGSQLIVREGTTVLPGTSGATFTGGITAPGTSFNNAGQGIIGLTLQGGDVVGTTNNAGVFFMNSDGSLSAAARKGQAAPGTDAVFSAIGSQATLFINNAGQYVFQGNVTGGTSDATNSAGIWLSAPGSPSTLSLVARQGSAAAGAPEVTYAFGANSTLINGLGQLLMIMPLSDNSSALYAYDPTAPVPLAMLARTGEQLEVAPGVFRTISGFGPLQFSNGSGSPLAFNDSGQFVVTANTLEGLPAIITGRIPTPGAGALAILGVATLGRRRRRH